ncbi:MAG: porin [Phycisphaerales bacterium]
MRPSFRKPPRFARRTPALGSLLLAAGSASCAFAQGAASAPAAPPAASPGAGPIALPPDVLQRLERMQREIDSLREQNQQQAERIDTLQRSTGEAWLTEQRAEQVRGIVSDVLADSQTRTSLQGDIATAGYDKNFFIASPDGNYRLAIEGSIQARFAYNNIPQASISGANAGRSQVANEYGFEMRRVLLNFFGHVIDPSWTYRVQLAANRNGELNNHDIELQDAFIQKAFDGGLFVRMGQWKNYFNYEEMNSSRTQQFAERSLLNSYYSTKFVQGVLLGWLAGDTQVYAAYNDGGGNRNMQIMQQGTGNPTEWAFTGRVQQKLAGAWYQFLDMQGWRGSEFGAMIGLAVNWQRAGGLPPTNRATPGNGSLPAAGGGGTVNDQITMFSYTADLNLRGDGWSAWAAFLGNLAYGGGAVANAVGVNNSNSLGAVIQAGYFLTERLELIGRYEGLWVSSDNNNVTSGSALVAQTLNIITIGLNYYFAKNAAKLTLDGGYSFEPVLFSNGIYGESISGADWRVSQTGQGGGETVVRVQMQLLF